jgi:hypothetical protein
LVGSSWGLLAGKVWQLGGGGGCVAWSHHQAYEDQIGRGQTRMGWQLKAKLKSRMGLGLGFQVTLKPSGLEIVPRP